VILGLTVVWVALDWSFRTPNGLLRSTYREASVRGEPFRQETTTDISLEFLENDGLRRWVGVRWEGFWYFPRRQTITLHVSADDRATVRLNDVIVVDHRVNDTVSTSTRSLALGAGAHRIAIEFEQYDGDLSLNVRWATPGTSPRALPASRLFPEALTASAYWMGTALGWLRNILIGLWGSLALVSLAQFPKLAGSAGRAVALTWHGRAQLSGMFARTSQQLRGQLFEREGSWTWSEFRRRLSAVALTGLVGPTALFLVGPYTIYTANRAEFNVPFFDVALPSLLLVAGISWGLLVAAGCVVALLSERLTHLYTALLFAVGLLFWMQGNLWVGDYGALTGDEIDFTGQAWRGPYDMGVWVVVLGVAIVFARPISRIAPLASALFASLQAVLLAGSIASSDEVIRLTGRRWRPPQDPIYELSRNRNVIHIVLDGFYSETFREIAGQSRTEMDRSLSGFVFFANHLGAFPTTRASMPAMLTGVAYRNESTFNQYLRRVDDRSLFNVLGRRGYRVNSVTFHPQEHPPESLPGREDATRYTIPTPFGGYDEYVRSAAATLLDLSLFRHSPHQFKPRIYNNDLWLFRSRFSQQEAARGARPSNHAAFLDWLANRMTISRDEPVYTFIHLAIPHPPMVVDADCLYIGRQRPNERAYLAQARCALKVVGQFLDRLRALGAYDRSVIVLSSDHGWPVFRREHPLRSVRTPAGSLDQVATHAMPLLAVKPVDGSGPLRTSRAPTALTDIPATIFDLVGLPYESAGGVPALRVNEEAIRSREFVDHSWTNVSWDRPYFDLLRLFSVRGPILQASSWRFQGAIADPTEDLDALFERYQSGLSEIDQGDDGPFRWGDVHIVTYAPPDARLLSFDVRRAPAATFTQTLTVQIDGQVVARRQLADDSWVSVQETFPGWGTSRTNPYCVELLVNPPAGSEDRRQGALYRGLEWAR
jgi:hypothetical protein